jgi:hypothetical protein
VPSLTGDQRRELSRALQTGPGVPMIEVGLTGRACATVSSPSSPIRFGVIGLAICLLPLRRPFVAEGESVPACPKWRAFYDAEAETHLSNPDHVHASVLRGLQSL